MNAEFDKLIEFLEEKFDFEPHYKDYKYTTVEEVISESNESLKCEELGDYRNNIKEQIKVLEKYKDNYAIFGHDWSFPYGICLGYFIFDKDFNYIDVVICT